MSYIDCKSVIKSYKSNEKMPMRVLHNITMSIAHGEFVSIMGASGSGKTTLLHCMGTIDDYDSGEIIINGNSLHNLSETQKALFRRKHIGYVFQDYSLLPQLTVFENIAYPLFLSKYSVKKVQQNVTAAARTLDIAGLLEKYPAQISGGQQQRVAIARALIHRPDILLCDEPTGALDSVTARHLMDTFKQINQELATTLVVVTHDSTIASYADTVFIMLDGAIKQTIHKHDYSNSWEYADAVTHSLRKEMGSL